MPLETEWTNAIDELTTVGDLRGSSQAWSLDGGIRDFYYEPVLTHLVVSIGLSVVAGHSSSDCNSAFSCQFER